MKVLQPYYYDDFKCIADKCKDSCCHGWVVTIEKKSFLKYRKVKGEFGKRLNKNIRRLRKNSDIEYGQMILDDEMKCEFLNENNLCDMYIKMGAEYLCNTCTSYPRSICNYQNIAEKNLSLSCPRVSEILVNSKEQLDFIMKDELVEKLGVNSENILESKTDRGLYDLLWIGRSFSIDIAQFKEIPIWKRLVFVKITEGKLQELINSKEFTKVNETIENLRNEITKQDVIDSLDKINKINNIVKLNLITSIIEVRIKLGISNNRFINMINNINELIIGKTNDEIQVMLKEKENRFDEYFKDKEYILENYIVYYLYNRYMKVLKNKNLNKEITILMISYSIIKLFLISIWVKNKEQLGNEDIVDVLYSFSRTIEHNRKFMGLVYNQMKSNGYDSLGYLVTLIY